MITIKSSWELLASLIFLYILIIIISNIKNYINIFLCLAVELEMAIKSNEIHVCIIAVS